MIDRPAILLNRVCLNYRVHFERQASIKGALLSKLRGKDRAEYFPAIKALSLTIRAGESVAIMGPNGSGKSTLLKLIAKVMEPSAGVVAVHGTVAALLELGAGFDPELTGVENIRLNAALLGLPGKWVRDNLERIAAFSELGPFLESPMRHYSTGMFMRLGFSIAVHADADLLLFDEGLAVGDAGFQSKCYQALLKRKEQGATMVLVSHSPRALAGICERGIVLRHGRIDFDGSPREAADRYEGGFSRAK